MHVCMSVGFWSICKYMSMSAYLYNEGTKHRNNMSMLLHAWMYVGAHVCLHINMH